MGDDESSGRHDTPNVLLRLYKFQQQNVQL